MSDEPDTDCRICFQPMIVEDGCEPTGICHNCAQHRVVKLEAALAVEIETSNAAVFLVKRMAEQKIELMKMLAATPHVLGHPADASWCEAVDEHHAATEAELKETRRRLKIVHEYLIAVWKMNVLPVGMNDKLIKSLNEPI